MEDVGQKNNMHTHTLIDEKMKISLSKDFALKHSRTYELHTILMSKIEYIQFSPRLIENNKSHFTS